MEKNKDKAGMTENPELAAEFAAMQAALNETPESLLFRGTKITRRETVFCLCVSCRAYITTE